MGCGQSVSPAPAPANGQQSIVKAAFLRRTSVASRSDELTGVQQPFPLHVIGFHSNPGCKPIQGKVKEKINQDRAMICHPLFGEPGQLCLAVFDGHGPAGEKMSEFVGFALMEILEGAR